MEYILITIVLFILILLYFRIAKYYNIIDKSITRSTHLENTLRGGGIVYFFAFLLFLIMMYGAKIVTIQNFLIFGIGFLVITVISFWDDMMDLSIKIRLFFQFVSATFLVYFIGAFQILPFWVLPALYIMVVGILNAYNFMDGINGMSGLYSLLTLGTLWYINSFFITFTDTDFVIYPILATIVFLFFNFRKNARIFMGDVGSIGIAFWILGLLGLLIMKSQNLKYLLLLSIYGVEVILTILERLKLKENIFEAHKRHLYELLVYKKKISHLWVSTIYMAIQLIINILVLKLNYSGWIIYSLILFPSLIIYLIIKTSCLVLK